jgi:hypothetical protein
VAAPTGKAVTSSAPGGGPRDLSQDLQRHREQSDATVTCPPGGYPTTVGGNPNAPDVRQTSDDDSGGPVLAPGPYSQATQWAGGGANY